MAQQQPCGGMHMSSSPHMHMRMKKPSHSRRRNRLFSGLHPQASSSLVMMRKQNHQTDMGSLRRSLRRRSRECSVRVAVDGNSNSSSSPAGAGGGTSTTTSSSSSSSSACDKYFEDDTRPIVLFDGVCMLCNGGVDMMLRFDTNANARFAALQSEAGQNLLTRAGRAPDDISSIVLCESDGTSHVKSDAILRIAQLMDIPFRIIAPLGFLFPSGFRDGVYDVISENRYNFFGSAEACRFRDPDFNSRFVE